MCNSAGFATKDLKRLHDDDNAKGVPGAMADKPRNLLFALETADSLDQVGRFPGGELHSLKGGLKGFWSQGGARCR